MSRRIELFAFDLDAALPPDAPGWLNDAERERAMRFATATLRHRFIAGRATLRRLLADRLGETPGRLPIEDDADGKPRLGDHRLAFNLSHAANHALLAIGPAGLALGIDIERIEAIADVEALVTICLSPAEQADFSVVADEVTRREKFLRLWVRKEACLKAIGQGLRIEPAKVTVGFPPLGADWPARIREDHLRVSDIDLGLAAPAAGLAAALAVVGSGPMPPVAPLARLAPGLQRD